MSSSPVRTSADRSFRPEPSSPAAPPTSAGAAAGSGLLASSGTFGRLADRLVADDLPDLPVDRRDATVDFVCRRAGQVPTPLRIGLIGLTAATVIGERIVGPHRMVRFLRTTSLPFVAEFPRIVRSLGFAYIWESWPDTSPTGAPG